MPCPCSWRGRCGPVPGGSRETWRAWLLALVTFFAVWQSVQALKPFADLLGPGTRRDGVTSPD